MTEATTAVKEIFVGATYKTRKGEKVVITSGPLNGYQDREGSFPFVGALTGGVWKRFKRDGTAIGQHEDDRAFDIVEFGEVEPRRGPGLPAPIALRTGWCFEDKEGRRFVIGQQNGSRFSALNGTSTWAGNGKVNSEIDYDTRWDLVTEIGEAVKDATGKPTHTVLYEGIWVTRGGEKIRVRPVESGTVIVSGVRPDFVGYLHKESVYYDKMGKAIAPGNQLKDIMHHFNTSWVPGAEDPGDKPPQQVETKPTDAPKPPDAVKKEEDDLTVPHEDLIQAVLRKEPVQMKRPDGTWEDLRNRTFAITMLMTQADKEFRLKPLEILIWGHVERMSEHRAVFTSHVSEFEARTAVNQASERRTLVRVLLDKDLKCIEFKHMAP